jgi:hypothetical protein
MNPSLLTLSIVVACIGVFINYFSWYSYFGYIRISIGGTKKKKLFTLPWLKIVFF